MNDDQEPTNVFKFGAINGGKEEEKSSFPHSDYVIVDLDDHEFDINGFLIFTPHHLAIMRNTEDGGATPVLVMPLSRVKIAALASVIDGDGEEELPF